MNQKEELEKAFYTMPIHQDLLEHWKKNTETDPIKKALRFLFLSNLTFMGSGDGIRYGAENPKKPISENIKKTFDYLEGVQLANKDFRDFFKILREKNASDSLIYCDPPYLGTTDNYSDSFKESDSIDLFDALQKTGCKWAMSEFDNPFILNQAKERALNVETIGERQNLKNRRTEILITSYKPQGILF
jgi:DNA adenine methylase